LKEQEENKKIKDEELKKKQIEHARRQKLEQKQAWKNKSHA
jgi:hypothetical protein